MTVTRDVRTVRQLSTGLVVLCALGLAASSCGSSGVRSGSPTAICGTTVAPGASEPLVWDMWRAHAVVREAGSGLIVRLTKSCSDGAAITIAPAGAFQVSRVVKGTGGGWVAAVLRPTKPESATLRATRQGKVVGTLRTDITRSGM
jgi:hypothetical protein